MSRCVVRLFCVALLIPHAACGNGDANDDVGGTNEGTLGAESSSGDGASSADGSASADGNSAGDGDSASDGDPSGDGDVDGDGDTAVDDAGNSAGDGDGDSCSATLLFANDFDDDTPGPYSDLADWNEPPWDNGVDEGRVEIIEGADAYQGRSLRVHYPQGGVGPSEGGAQWTLLFEEAHDELYLSYRLRFADDFDFVLGGKLPGLVGGTAPTGCVDDDTGFSARSMWRTAGAGVQYMYYPDKVETCGEDYDYSNTNGPVHFEPGVWHAVRTRIQVNTPGQADGVLETWVDGELVLDVQDFVYRLADGTYAINGMYFSTFFGGSSAQWGPTKDETIDFDDFVVCTGPIG